MRAPPSPSPAFPARLSLTFASAALLLVSVFWAFWLLAAPSGNDLLVYGGTPQGVMAAVAAAQQGQQVVLVLPGRQLGGVLTRSWLTTLDMSVGPDGQPLSRGLMLGLYRQFDHDNSFDVGTAQRYFNALVRRPGIRVLTDLPLVRVSGRGGVVGCPLLGTGIHRRVICAARYIDASDDAAFAAQAGAPFTVGRNDRAAAPRQDVRVSQRWPARSAQMAAGLIFRVYGVHWGALYTALSAENQRQTASKGEGTSELLPALSTVTGRSVVGLSTLARRYRPSDPERFVLRGFNGARQSDGGLMVNALLVLNVDGTSPPAVEQARVQAEAEARRVVVFLREAQPEVFGQARYGGAAPELYMRESRHLIGEVRLHADDVFYGRHFTDAVAVNAYPLDGQQYRPGESPYLIGHPSPYEVPLRSLIPRGFSNLLVVSQAASFDSVAAFSARVVPLQMNLGEAAGLAAAVASQTHGNFQTLARSPLLTLALRTGLYRRGGLVRAPQNGQASGCHDALSPQYGNAVALLREGLMSAPYYYYGCLNLADGETGAAFLGDLQHGLSSAALTLPARQPALDWLRTFYATAPQTPLERSDARAILQLLGLPAPTLGSREQTFTRAEAALLRSRLLDAPAPHGAGHP